jgi:hypothetical protein
MSRAGNVPRSGDPATPVPMPATIPGSREVATWTDSSMSSSWVLEP